MISMMSEKKKAKDILDKADETLRVLDAASIFSTIEVRQFPQFEVAEIVAGALLGKGGFSDVHEVEAIHLDAAKKNNTEQNAQEGPISTGTEATTNKENKKVLDHSESSGISPLDSAHAEGTKKEHDEHYDVETARDFMSKNYLRNGSARYAIKSLRPDLSVVDRARGALDLAIEIKYLTAIWHPNIIKMRGYSETPRVSEKTFVILDRLYGTLHDKIEEWAQATAGTKGCCGVSEKDPEMLEILKQRLLVAYDLASAFNYLHGHRLLYRDIKPENIGFDIRGDVKLFDFGLCRSLERKDKVKDGYGYKLTRMTGSIPYMAPEVAAPGGTYGLEADVYSFAVLLWEIISLEWAYNGYDMRQYFVLVCQRNFRAPIKRSWPAMVRVVIQEGWDPNPEKRPAMKRVGTLLRGELQDMTTDSTVMNRTQHMMNRSRRSFRGIMDGSRGRQMDGSRGRRSMLSSRSTRNMFVGGDQVETGEGAATEDATEG